MSFDKIFDLTAGAYFHFYNANDDSFLRIFGQEFFSVSASVCDPRNRNSRSISFVRAPSSGGGSNVPGSAVPVPHLDVNTDRR